jgi:hypothetical protein
MPSIYIIIISKQQQLTFMPISLNTRGTPYRNRPAVLNYVRLERINEPFKNPIPTPHYTRHPL